MAEWIVSLLFLLKHNISQHNAKPENPVTECVQQTMVMKYDDRKEPQLLICHAGVTFFLTWVSLAEQVSKKHWYFSYQYSLRTAVPLCRLSCFC